jgi:hypothetical protein
MRYFVFLGIILIMTVLLLLVPTKTISEDIEVSYEENETYFVPETYTETVMVYPILPIQDFQDIAQSFSEGGCAPGCECDTYHYSGYTKICTYCINCPSPTVQPTEYQSVTKTRDVPNVRTVTRTRTEQRPSEVNWIFGFKTSYTLHLPVLAQL